MNIPFLNREAKPKSLADLAGESQSEAVNPFTRQAKLPFDKKHPRIERAISLNPTQLDDIKTRITVVSYTRNEFDFALSRTPADTDPVQVARLVGAIIYDWQAEGHNDSDAAAKRELLKGSSALSAVDAKLEAARQAHDLAQRERAELDRSYHQFRAIPAQAEQLTNKVASLGFERSRLTATDFDAKIRQLLDAEYNPRPGMIIHENIPSLLLQRDTLALRLQVIDELVVQCEAAMAQLTEDNTKLAEQLGIRAHKIS
jgi:hypothetical protein